jgi:hypothetical protein
MKAIDVLKLFMVSMFALRKWPKVSEWVPKNMWIPKMAGRKPAFWSLARNPAFAEILDTFTDRRVKYVYLCFGTQLGKTTLLFAILLYNIVYRKYNSLWIFPNKEDGVFLSETRWRPLLESCKPAFAELLSTRGANNQDRQLFIDCFIRFVGSFGKTGVQSTPAELLLFDEVDNLAMGKVRDGEVSTGALVAGTERLKDSPDGKAYYSGSPKSPNGAIWTGLESSDWRVFYMPSPHAPDKEWITFEWGSPETKGGIKWSPDAKDPVTGEWDISKVIETCYYACPHTGLPITTAHKQVMLRKGKWVSTNPKADPEKRGYQMSSLYAADYPWEKITREYFNKRSQPGGLIQFINGWLAEPYRPKAQHVSDELLILRSKEEKDGEGNVTFKPYLRGTIKGNARILMGVDVQMNHLWFVVRGHDADFKTSYLIDYGMVGHFDDLDPIYKKYQVSGLIIDTGHRAKETLRAIYERRKLGYNWFGVKGYGVKSQGAMKDDVFIRPNKGDPFMMTPNAGKVTVPVLDSNNPHWYENYFKLRNGSLPGWHLPHDVCQEYMKQAMNVRSEEKVDERGNKSTDIAIKGDDHMPDCERYECLLASYLNIWGRQYVPTTEEVAQAQPAKKKPRIRFS